MINWLIRILSFVICLALLAGGVILTVSFTMDNDDLKADFQDISDAPWIPEYTEADDENQTPEGGDENLEGGEENPESGEENPESGDSVTE